MLFLLVRWCFATKPIFLRGVVPAVAAIDLLVKIASIIIKFKEVIILNEL